MALQLNQELQNKYPHLEVSVLKYSDAMKDNDSKRIDSEFFKKEYLENLKILKNHNVEILGNLVKKITGGATPLGANYPENGVPFLRVQNIMQNYFNLSDIVYISQKDDEEIKRSRLKLNDVLLTITGVSYGKSAVVDKNLVGTNINQHSVKIEVKSINPYFLSTFLNSKFGYSQSSKSVVGVTRPALDYQAIKKFIVPIFSNEFQQQIEQMVRESHECLEQSKGLYREAEVLLYRELGLDPENPLASIEPHSGSLNISVRPLSQSLNATGRLDSEYYQDKYDLMEKQIKKNGFKTLEEICSLINYGSVPTSPYSETDKGVPYIKGLNLKNLQIDETKLDRITNTEDLNSRFFTKENDIVISQMGTVGDVGVVSKEQENYIFASFTIRVRLKNIEEFNPYFVALYIQNIAKEWYLYRNIAQASVRQNTDLPTIRNLYVPLVSYEKQTQIAEKIKQSFTLRKQANELLQQAKSKVETAIEQPSF